ncbi:MAG TPA: hypothetical protein P5084_02870 [Paludibacter sp.]|nr:hypothetical protein [Paludibacter sp.]
MKVTFKVMIIISFMLLVLVGFQLVDSYLSLNYDPENYTPNKWQRDYSVLAIRSKIIWLWVFFAYMLTNIFILFKALKKKHSSSK